MRGTSPRPPASRLEFAEGLAAHVLEVADQIITPEVRSGGGFADAVPAGPGADVMDRLIAFTGRNVPAGRTASS